MSLSTKANKVIKTPVQLLTNQITLAIKADKKVVSMISAFWENKDKQSIIEVAIALHGLKMDH